MVKFRPVLFFVLLRIFGSTLRYMNRIWSAYPRSVTFYSISKQIYKRAAGPHPGGHATALQSFDCDLRHGTSRD